MPTLIPIGPAANTPGEILRTEFLEPLGLSQNELATRSGLDRMRISEIVRGRRRLTAETAIAFAKVFEIEPQFWLNLQVADRRMKGARIRRDRHRSGALVSWCWKRLRADHQRR